MPSAASTKTVKTSKKAEVTKQEESPPVRSKVKTPSTSSDSQGEKRKKKRKQTFSSHIYKVLKQVAQDIGISSKAMAIMNSMVNDFFERLSKEAAHLALLNKKATISYREIQSAVQLTLPGDLAKHAITEGRRALAKYNS
ncbi:late histone H2B.L4 [Galendromus occidentalis]|uniref:Late histone H2B.L4 n=1 Tax=Galendromus occidentalis TaxID=34638 RepID=A0AAJ6VXN0_9ACAR|nr:late histone H2B.L4 [Galendromus occidentalis]